MAQLKQLWERVQDSRLQATLILSFSLIAAITIIMGMAVTSRVIRDYLNEEAFARVRRGMTLGQAIYQDYLFTLVCAARRVAVHSVPYLVPGCETSLIPLTEELRLESASLGGNRFIIVFDAQGNVVAQDVYPSSGQLAPAGNWSAIPVVARALGIGNLASIREASGTTEVIPAEYLALLGLDEQARIVIKETPKAAPKPFDPREGSAGLILAGTAPIVDEKGAIIGAVLAGHLINNDFFLVDRIKEVGYLDTVTLFFGDLRVSTNVVTEQGERAIGTRVSRAVRDVLLEKGEVFEERAFVVNEWYITRYDPLRDHQGHVVGSLYVGMRESGFQRLVREFNERIFLIAFGTILMAFLMAIPVARSIVKPLSALVEASHRVAEGDMDVRVPVQGRGELATLAHSFNEMVATLRDTRAELVRKEKLASVGQLAAGVAHEINNPLGTVLLYADTMRKELPEDDPRQLDFQMIIDETMRCKHIVGDLLNFARQRQLTVKETDINALVQKTLNEFSIQPDFQGIHAVVDLDPNLPSIQADESQIRQVLTNLIDNAVDAMDGHGRLTVSTRRVAGDMVEVSISDTGMGIPEEQQKEIFTPFFTTKPVGKGTGLGLSIVYGIVKMHQGQINVRSQVGEGATFTVMLPIKLPGRNNRNRIVG